MKFFNISLLLFFLLYANTMFAQHTTFSRQDTLRGSITPEREWWDLMHYDLNINVDIPNQSLEGFNSIKYKVIKPHNLLQIDLQEPMKITKVLSGKSKLDFEQEGNAYFIHLKKKQQIGEENQLEVYFKGNPKVAFRPPWDATITWSKDKNGKPFVATSCQGDGASMWWPCKDHMYDEPEQGMDIKIRVPENLMDVSNGRLVKVTKQKNKTKTYHWSVKNPINNYGVNINIGDYVHFGEKYKGENGTLDCDYYVLKDNLEAAKKQFKQVPLMLEAFEHWFGPYPFYEDSYKLVETPYLGMEHQSSVTYGNQFRNGYLGRDLSKTGWGLKFDFIIIHESGHEWFANNITNKDIADMWIHESFTAYSENLYLDFHFGKEAASEYVLGTRSMIKNESPIIGTYGVNRPGSGTDMYYKGANMLHTLRQLVNDDEKWRTILRGLNKTFYHQTVDSKQIEDYISKQAAINLEPFFDQYLRDIRVPILEYYVLDGVLNYRWTNCNSSFDMKCKVIIDGKEKWITPSTSWNVTKNISSDAKIQVDPNFYVASHILTNK